MTTVYCTFVCVCVWYDIHFFLHLNTTLTSASTLILVCAPLFVHPSGTRRTNSTGPWQTWFQESTLEEMLLKKFGGKDGQEGKSRKEKVTDLSDSPRASLTSLFFGPAISQGQASALGLAVSPPGTTRLLLVCIWNTGIFSG